MSGFDVPERPAIMMPHEVHEYSIDASGDARLSATELHSLREMAKVGDKASIVRLISYYDSPNTVADHIFWLKKLAALGESGAYFSLGMTFLSSNYFDVSEAVENLKMAADCGHAMAQYYLGDLYFEDRLIGKDLDKSYFWFYVSSVSGFAPAASMLSELNCLIPLERREVLMEQARGWILKHKK